MTTVDPNQVNVVSPTSRPKDRVRAHFGDFGESITIKDFNQKVVGTAHILANGNFQVPEGQVKPEDLGKYILRITGHPKA